MFSRSTSGSTANRLVFLWCGVAIEIALAIFILLFEEAIASSNTLICAVLLASVPAGIAYLILAIELLKKLKLKALLLIPLVWIPKVFVIALLGAPIMYLATCTAIYLNTNKLSSRKKI